MVEKSAKTDRPSIVSALYFYKAPNTLSSCEVLTEQQRLNSLFCTRHLRDRLVETCCSHRFDGFAGALGTEMKGEKKMTIQMVTAPS
jgi:hypothetical protein